MNKLTILDLNIQNSIYKPKNDDYYINRLKQFMMQNDIDVACLQEITPNGIDEIRTVFSDYNIYSESRLKSNSIFKLYKKELDESLPIISKYEISMTKSYWLSRRIMKKGSSSYFSFFPRVVNVCKINTNIGNIVFINVHLDFIFNYTKKKQLMSLKKILEIYKKEKLVLLGDFNIDINDKLYNYLLELVEINNLKYVYYNEATFENLKIDHIFVSNGLNVDDIQIKDVEKGFSDHKGLIVKLYK